jgi:hypothetical protein
VHLLSRDRVRDARDEDDRPVDGQLLVEPEHCPTLSDSSEFQSTFDKS